MTRAEKAIALFESGANCAQAVFAAFAELMDIDEKTALRLASPFGGGFARQREVCGAVSGMCMVAGMLYGYDVLTDDRIKAEHYRLIQALCNEFRAQYGSIVCRELLEKRQATTGHVPTPRTEEFYRIRPCARQVGTAAEILEKYIGEHPIS